MDTRCCSIADDNSNWSFDMVCCSLLCGLEIIDCDVLMVWSLVFCWLSVSLGTWPWSWPSMMVDRLDVIHRFLLMTRMIDIVDNDIKTLWCSSSIGQPTSLVIRLARAFSDYDINARTKPHLNVGTIGHVDHGKTTLTAAITKVWHNNLWLTHTIYSILRCEWSMFGMWRNFPGWDVCPIALIIILACY